MIDVGILADAMTEEKTGLIRRYRGFRRDAKLMITAGLIDHLGFTLIFGFVLILYLDILGHSSVLFGTLMTVMEVSHVFVLLGSGHLADRYGRRRIMLLGMALGTSGFMIFAFFESVPLFFLAMILIGASNGFWGPAYSAFLTEKTTAKRRKYLFSLNSIIGQLGSGTISLIGGFIPLFFVTNFGLDDGSAYRMIFVFALFLKVAGILLVLRLKRDKPKKARRRTESDIKPPWRLIFRFTLPTAFTGLGAGLLVPYFPKYFDLRFGLEIETIGIIFALLSFVMAMMTFFLPRMAEKSGTIFTTTIFHFSAIIAMISIPFTPWLLFVVFLVIFRAAMMNVPGPIMTSFMMGKMPRNVRATAQGANAFSWMSTHAVGIFIGGFLWDWDTSLKIPFYIATVLYIISASLYLAFFIRMDDKKHKPITFRPRLHPK